MGIEQRYLDSFGNELDKAVINPGDRLKSTLKFVNLNTNNNGGYSEREHQVTVFCNQNDRYGFLGLYLNGKRVYARKLKPGHITSQFIRGYTGLEIVEWEFIPERVNAPPTP